jgi:hypothetical protein
VNPVGPVVPEGPVNPVNPVEPVYPVNPVVPEGPVNPVKPVAPLAPVYPVNPVAPCNAVFTYSRSFHSLVPLPILSFDVSVSYPGSPAMSTGFASNHCNAVPFRSWKRTDITYYLNRNSYLDLLPR